MAVDFITDRIATSRRETAGISVTHSSDFTSGFFDHSEI